MSIPENSWAYMRLVLVNCCEHLDSSESTNVEELGWRSEPSATVDDKLVRRDPTAEASGCGGVTGETGNRLLTMSLRHTRSLRWRQSPSIDRTTTMPTHWVQATNRLSSSYLGVFLHSLVDVIDQIVIAPGGSVVAWACNHLNLLLVAIGIPRVSGTLRREILNAEWFSTIKQAKTVIGKWLRQYNHVRPHQALNMRPPVPETLQTSGP